MRPGTELVTMKVGMDLLIFDLDGTLIDSKLDLAHSVNAMLAHMGRQQIDNDIISSYVGNGAPVLVLRALGSEAGDADVEKGLEYFLAYYAEHKLDCTRAYPGVREALDRLHEDGVKLSVLTNKPVRISKAILEGLGLNYFERVYGGNSFEQKKPHAVGVNTILAELHVRRERAMMVGDSSVDVRTARNAKIKCCGVTYGFQPESLSEEPPDLLVDNMEELARQVITERKVGEKLQS
jgi:phosphoglycolate phosphatase